MMKNTTDHTAIEIKPCPDSCDYYALHVWVARDGSSLTIQCFECGRTRTGSCRDIPSIVTAWNGEDPQ